MRSQIVISNGRGGNRYSTYAFTEQGVAMLSSVLRSQTANIFNPAQYAIFFDFPTLGYKAFQLFVFSCEFLIFKNIHYFIVFVNYIIDDNLAILI